MTRWTPSVALPLALCLVQHAGAVAAQSSSPSPASAALDFAFFKDRVQPIFLNKRPGHARCYACHSQGTTFRLQRMSGDATAWSEDESRRNFEAVQRLLNPRNPLESRLLLVPLASEAGGILIHSGGKHWFSRDDPEWRTLAAWVR